MYATDASSLRNGKIESTSLSLLENGSSPGVEATYEPNEQQRYHGSEVAQSNPPAQVTGTYIDESHDQTRVSDTIKKLESRFQGLLDA